MAISLVMQDDHRRCDAAFAAAESAVHQGRWATGRDALAAFVRDMERHLAAEEDLLFPAFERATGMSQGPTRMMRLEHGQMRELLEQMQTAAADEDAEEYAGASETLLVLMQQHNVKEERVLYPMCDSALDARALVPPLQQRLARGGSPS